MISNYQNLPQQTKQRQLNNCIHNSINKISSSILDSEIHSRTSLQSTTIKMSRMAAASAANQKPLVKSPMEAVVVNSIIYSKPSFCRISVDLGEMPVGKKYTTTTKLTNGSCSNNIACVTETICSSSMDIKNASSNFNASSCLAGLAQTSSSSDVGDDAKLYRMCTTLNGSINHQISDLCDNILAMAGFYGVTSNGHDSFIKFAYRDDSDDDDEDEDDKDDLIDDEYDEYDYDDEVDDDYDVVDFSYECPIEPAPKFNCDRKKKVRFNTAPTVHNMHTWSYAYRAARKGEWEMYARDRERFKLRIQRAALMLNPILEREHRQKIYEKRFANLYNYDYGQKPISIDIMQSKKISTSNESKKPHQKKKRKKRRYCKMGNKHYF